MNTTGNFAEQAGKAQIDLIGDDNETMISKKNQLRWDSKKHKFVKGTGIGSDNKKMIRTESGALIPASYKSGRYDEWAKKTRTSLPRTGEMELPSARNFQQKHHGRFKHTKMEEAKPLDPLSIDYERKLKKRKYQSDESSSPSSANNNNGNKKKKVAMGQRTEGGRNAVNEIKDASQIRKARVLLTKRKEKSNHVPSKGKGRGRGKGKGRH